MILGCDATEVDDPDFTATRRASIDQIVDYFKEAWKYLPLDGDEFPMESVIGIFGGCRPHADTNDFVIGEAEDAPGFINAGGTESPGFTSAVAIARHVVQIAAEKLDAAKNEAFDPYRKVNKPFRTMTNEERTRAIAENPDYAKVVCRCEMVTEAEIPGRYQKTSGCTVGIRSQAAYPCRNGQMSGRFLRPACSGNIM